MDSLPKPEASSQLSSPVHHSLGLPTSMLPGPSASSSASQLTLAPSTSDIELSVMPKAMDEEYSFSLPAPPPATITTAAEAAPVSTADLKRRGPTKFILNVLWQILNVGILLQLPGSYLRRFQEYAKDTKASEVAVWRKAQQNEWDRLSTALVLLAASNAAILALPETLKTPDVSIVCWVSGFGLSVCGVIMVQYFPIKCFDLPPSVLARTVSEKGPGGTPSYLIPTLLAIGCSCPPLFAIWSSVLLVVGMWFFIFLADIGSFRVRALAFVSVGFASLMVILVIAFGEAVTRMINHQRRLNREDKTRWQEEGNVLGLDPA